MRIYALLPILMAIVIFLVVSSMALGKEYELESPNKTIRVVISIEDNISYTVYFKSQQVLASSPLSLAIRDFGILGHNPKLIKVNHRSINEILIPVVPEKSSTIRDNFNELSLELESSFGIDFRAYDEGVAYRFRTEFVEEIQVLSEEVAFHFEADHKVYFPTEESFLTHSERVYETIPMSSIPSEKMASLPVLVDPKAGPKIAITEVDLQDYPGLYLRGQNNHSLTGLFPAVAVKEEQTRDRTVEVRERADYIAKTKGKRSFPWRVLIVAENDADLIYCQLVYKLSPALELKDTSWIKPGKVAWDWWNANNIFGVDFTAGINTQTYKYYIDFASQHGIEYVIFDEGWYELGDLFKINPDMDMEELLDYAQKKNVGIILWVVWKTLDDQLQAALDQFEQWGVKGIKVDFMQRDDKWMVNYYWKIAAEAAKRKLLVDFHGSYKPSGLRRAYPNVLTREGVRGLEHVKWSKHPTPKHNVTLPFIRMLAGPMDYTPGAMINAQEKNFLPVFTRPMSMGTRCHQLAMYVVYESPLQMLADSPSHYLREPECLDFLSRVPTTWDQTWVLDAQVAEYVLLARRKDNEWYVGAMTNWTPRELRVDLGFLEDGEYSIEIYQDGPNAARYGNDFQKSIQKVTPTDRILIQLAPGGGWAARIFK